MTLRDLGSYTFLAIRPVLAISVVALCACATDSTTRAQLVELNAQLRAMRAENGRLEARLERLEQHVAVASARPLSASSASRASVTPPAEKSEKTELPALTVVKLKPKKEAPPKLSTDVAVVEPPEGMIAELKTASPGAEPKDKEFDETDQRIADEQYEQGVAALKTGNVEGAVKNLTAFAQDWPKHPRADNALYFAGFGQMALKEYDNAEKTFQEALARYPAGDAVLDTLLKLAECRYKLNRPQEAKATWEKIVTGFPGTAAAQAAQQRLASLPAGKPASPE